MFTTLFSRKHALLVSVALAFLMTGQLNAQTGPAKGDLQVLAVGVNHPTWGKMEALHSADKDAKAHEVFWPGQEGKLFGRVNVSALTNEQATRQAILAKLQHLVDGARPSDTVILALAGHGGVVRPGQWEYCAYDQAVTTADLQPLVAALAAKGVRVLLIIDTCQSGGVGIQGDNIIVLASCQSDQSAGEREDHGFFTKALLEGLAGAADVNHDGVITLAELNAYVAQRMEQLNSKQSPTCGCSANIRSNLPLAMHGSPAPTVNPVQGHGTGPITTPTTGPIK